MSDDKPMGQVIQIDEARIRDHLPDSTITSPSDLFKGKDLSSSLPPLPLVF
jgi:hypothetical protein